MPSDFNGPNPASLPVKTILDYRHANKPYDGLGDMSFKRTADMSNDYHASDFIKVKDALSNTNLSGSAAINHTF